MTSAPAQHWLPESAFIGPATITPLADRVREWSELWLAEGELGQHDGWRKIPGPLPDMQVAVGEGWAILCLGECRFQLAAQILGCEVNARRLRTPQDRSVIDLLLDEALASLGGSLRSEIGSAPLPEGDSWWALDFGPDPSRPVFAILCSRSRLVDFARRLAQPQRAEPALSPLAAAITEQPVTLTARLGSCRLSLAEIEALEAGDTIVLDQPTNQRVDLLIAGGEAGQAAATVSAGAHNLILSIESSTDQW